MKARITSACLFALLLTLGPAQAKGDGEAEALLTPEMLVDLKFVSGVELDPEGEHVAYLLEVPRTASDDPGRSYRELWVADLVTGKSRRYTSREERVSSPAFAPDGKSITFLVKREKTHEHTQIYKIRLRGGEARLVTRHESSIGSYRWSPDGRWIAFTATDPETDEEKKDEESGRDWEDHGQNPKFARLWLFDVKKKKSRQLTDGDFNVSDFTWADDESLVVRAAATPRVDDDYMFTQLYAVATNGDGSAPRQLTTTPGKLGEMEVSPDGRHLAFLGAVSQNDPLAQSLFVVPVAGGAAKNLTPDYKGSTARLAWWDDDTVFLVAVEKERHRLYKVDAASGERQALEWPSLVVSDFDLQPENNRLAVAAHSPSHPRDLYVAAADGSGLERFHDHNPDLGGVRLARQEVIEWTGAEGWTIGGVLTYPLDYEPGQRYPLVLQVHGGPEGVSLDGWGTTPGYPVQLLASDGFLVLQPNYRGSQGRGVDYSKADHDDLGGAEFEDILAGVAALVERGLADPERVGTGGWSYGGYMSAWAATRHSERFQAAVVAAGLTNWVSFTGTTDIPYEMSLVHWNSWWFDEPELHWQRSPLAHINKARTPTLLLHGANDERVHPEQSLELYTALRVKDVPTRYVLYPREPHGLNERAHRLDAIERIRGWFAEYLTVPEVSGVEERRD